MGYMNFKSPALEKMFKSFKWARNNTILLFEEAQNNNILDYKSTSSSNNSYTFQPLLFQFQCIVTTTDTYFRKLTNSKNTQFGVLVQDDEIISKKDISEVELKKLLQNQIIELQNLLKDFSEKQLEENIDLIQTISNHEYLHQGQMIIDFREAGIDLPERYRKAWAL